MNWVSFALGAFAGFICADLLWRCLYWLTMKLVHEQRSYISELQRYIAEFRKALEIKS